MVKRQGPNMVNYRRNGHLFSICRNVFGAACLPRGDSMSDARHGGRKFLAQWESMPSRRSWRARVHAAVPMYAARILASAWIWH